MSYSKIVSGMPGFQTLWKRSTALGSQVGPNAQMIYTGDRVQSPAGSTFYAPLNADTVDHKGYAPDTFTRASPGLYENQAGEWQTAADNAARFENRMLLMEPAITNKCTNYNAQIDAALQNIIVSGPGIVSRVDDSAALGSAGLSTIVGSFAVDLDNTAGGATTFVTVGGQTGNTNEHALSAFARKIAGAGDVFLRYNNGVGAVSFTNQGYERIITVAAATLATAQLQLVATAGSHLRFVLNQLEESPVVTSPIVTQGASASRAVDALSYASADQFFSQSQGMAAVTMRPRFDKADLATTEGLLTVSSAVKANLLYFDTAFQSSDGINIASVNTPAYVANDSIRVAVIYGPAGASALQVGYSLNGSAWVWSAAVAYDGGFATNDILAICTGIGISMGVSDVVIYDENKGTTWLEANY